MLTDDHNILSVSDIIKFMFAGNSEFTIKNESSGNQFTYSIKKAKVNKMYKNYVLYFVSVCRAYNTYNYAGTITIKDTNKYTYKKGEKGNINEDAQSIRVLEYVIRHALNNTLPSCVNVYHTGKCGRCGRKLTDAESIRLGLGPECRKLV